MRKSPLGLVVLIVLLLAGAAVAVYFVMQDDKPHPKPRAKAADVEAPPTVNKTQPLTDKPSPQPEPEPETTPEPQPKPEPKPAPEPKSEPEPTPEVRAESVPESLGFPKPTDTSTTVGAKDGEEALTFGTVLDEDGKPLDNANIIITVVHTAPDGLHTTESVQGGRSNKEGKFSIRFHYQVREGSQAECAVNAAKNGYYCASITTPNPDGPAELTLHKTEEGSSIEGDLVDGSGAPATNQKVYCGGQLLVLDPDSLRMMSRDVQEALEPSATRDWTLNANSDANGHFVIKRVPQGRFNVWVGGPAPENATDSEEVDVYEGRDSMLSRALTVQAPPDQPPEEG